MGKALVRKTDAALSEREEQRRGALLRAKTAGGFAAVGLVLWYLPIVHLLAYPVIAAAFGFAWLAARKLVK
jgi:hypothetical protein